LDKIKGKGKYYVRLHILKILYENKYLFFKKIHLYKDKKKYRRIGRTFYKIKYIQNNKKKLLFKRCSLNEIKDKRY
jgi:hypothetical protein